MSPETYDRRLKSIIEDMKELKEAGNDSPILRVKLFHLDKCLALIEGRDPFAHRLKGRDIIPRTVSFLRTRRCPATGQQIIKFLRSSYPELRDLRYHTFYPSLRGEVQSRPSKWGPRKHPRRVAECGKHDGSRLYGLPHWKSAKPYKYQAPFRAQR